MLGKGYLCAVVTQDAWQTPTTNMDMVRSEEGVQKRIAFRASIGRKSIPDGNLGEQMQRLHGQAAPANPSTDGSHQGLWPTATVPNGGQTTSGRADKASKRQVRLEHAVSYWPTITAHTPDMESSGPNGHSGTYLGGAVKSWLTPKVPSGGSQTERTTAGGGLRKLEDQTQTQTGKLNPRWVETLMGLPVGWVMPSCKSPVTIEPTNCASSATESCLPQPRELFEF
jgi:hypothetical protein